MYHFETTYVVNCVVNFLELGLTDANLTHFERSYVVICVVNLLELVKNWSKSTADPKMWYKCGTNIELLVNVSMRFMITLILCSKCRNPILYPASYYIGVSAPHTTLKT